MLLDRLEAEPRASQRSIAAELGIALGLANLLLRRLIRKGWVRMSRVSPGRVLYLITPAGLTAKADLARRCFLEDLAFYRSTRDHVRQRLSEVSASLDSGGRGGSGRVVFYGGGDVAEVAYVCLGEVGLQLAGVVDEAEGRVFDIPAQPASVLTGLAFGGRPFGGVIVMPPCDEEHVRRALQDRGVPAHKVFWL